MATTAARPRPPSWFPPSLPQARTPDRRDGDVQRPRQHGGRQRGLPQTRGRRRNNGGVLLAEIVATSRVVAATGSRLAKRSALADLLRTLTDVTDIEIAVAYLAGELRQRRTGLGWTSLSALPEPATEPTLHLAEVDAELETLSGLTGAGSSAERSQRVRRLLARATAGEQSFLRSLILGDVRQGALDSAMIDAVAHASRVPLPVIRRAVMLRGAVGPVAVAALTEGRQAAESFTLTVGRPVRPMLASSAPDVAAAFAKLGTSPDAMVDTKLDGVRIQVHKAGRDVGIFTRSLDDITVRLPEVVTLVRQLDVDDVILDGEAVALGRDGRPRPFQETAARTATSGEPASETTVSPFFFDCLYADGEALIDAPLRTRLQRLDAVVPAASIARRLLTEDPALGNAFFAEVVEAGQEGVVVKALGSTYDAGRRGAAWIKVKPRHTLDLVVLAVEEGNGRRAGTLSNIHLGARDPSTGGFVMLGKTFKGMTDEMLRWQTGRFTELATSRTARVVQVRPVQVVEVAFDGIQRSSRYPGGLALRFARVLRYRDDKSAVETDTIDTVRALAGPLGDPAHSDGSG
jgi:ATP-dependent DNA ligase I